jgi:hypothetical protein
LNLEVDLGNGTAAFTGTETTTQHENCAFGRVDHNFSSRDNIFTSYVLDNGQTVAATVPVAGYGRRLRPSRNNHSR